jgi:hypothetical protein
MQQTPLARLAEAKLGRPLDQFVRVRLAEGIGWRRIADELHTASGVRVSHEALRTWYGEPASAGAA